MKRRDFFRNSSLTLLGTTLLPPLTSYSNDSLLVKKSGKTARNIIFMVSDGMSTGTLNMADLLLQRKEGRRSNWLRLYEESKVKRALMDTSSANSLVTDSAAGSSSWGGGVKVPNGSLNVNADGTCNKPILQKFKQAGKSVGCVTTVPITHATPAGFSVNSKSRGDQAEIASQYLDLRFDVMMGGGAEYFLKDKRKDQTDLFAAFETAGFYIARNRESMLSADLSAKKPLLGVFAENGLPFSLDAAQDTLIQKNIPTLAEMTHFALRKLNQNPKGFVMQVEGGKVDWAAHANDTGGLLYDQIAFDDTVKVALDFAEKDKNTLVIITTDHGNANPGLFAGAKTNANFDRINSFKQTNEWILNGINNKFTPAQVIERIEAAQGYAISKTEAAKLLEYYTKLDEEGVYNPYKLPFKQLGVIQSAYTSVGWAGTDHSADFVELAMIGPGSELLKPFVKNTDLHELMLVATEVTV